MQDTGNSRELSVTSPLRPLWELAAVSCSGWPVTWPVPGMVMLLLQVLGVAKLGVTVIATFVVCWSPWLYSLDSAAQVRRHQACAQVHQRQHRPLNM